MEDNTAKYWFSWFYEKWEKNAPGELIEQGLTPSQIAERFVNENHDSFIKLSKKIDEKNYDALIAVSYTHLTLPTRKLV